jgi:16S rRNA (guanine966-N2)-methyltransferase
LVAPALASLRDGKWLSPNALAIVETAEDEIIPSTDGFELASERVYSDTRVGFLKVTELGA